MLSYAKLTCVVYFETDLWTTPRRHEQYVSYFLPVSCVYVMLSYAKLTLCLKKNLICRTNDATSSM
jgi:hypothetical protein